MVTFTVFRSRRIYATILSISIWSVCFLCAHLAAAQKAQQYKAGNYSFTHYDDRNGLPQNSVKSLAQDVDGFVWLTTENGLVRFDGTTFYVFDRSNVHISSNRFQSILPDMKRPFNRLYARHVEEGYLQRHDQYLRIERATTTMDSTVFDSVYKSAGSIGAYRDTYFPVSTTDLANPNFRPKNYIIPITEQEGSYFQFRDRKIKYYQGWKMSKEIVFPEAKFQEIFRLGKSLFYRSGDHMIRRLSFDGPEVKDTMISEKSLSGDIKNDPLYQSRSGKTRLYWNNTANQAFLSLGKNLYMLSEAGDANLSTRLMLTNFDLESNFIGTVLYSLTSRRVFLGSQTNGLFVVNKNDFLPVSSVSGGIDDIFYSQTMLDTGRVQTPNGRIFGLNGELSISLAKKIRAARRGMTEYRIATDHQGNIWTTRGNMLYCFADDGFTIQGKWDLKHEISDIHLGYDSTLWIAMAYDLLYRAKYEKGKIKLSLWADLQLQGKKINFLLQQKDGHIWVGTGAGLYSLNLKNKNLTLIPGTSSYNIRSLHISPGSVDNDLWMTSYNNGFALYKNGVVTAFPLDRNGYLTASHYIFEDSNGFFWIPTNKGLFQAKKSELIEYAMKKGAMEAPYYRHFDVIDGFKTNEFNGGCRPCAVRLGNGYVSLPSMNGLLFFIPGQVSPDEGTKQIYIDRVESHGKSLLIAGNQLTLSQDDKNRNIFVSTPFFGNTDNLVLSYALMPKGHSPEDRGWTTLNPGEGINISRLSHGKYLLYIRKRSGFGKECLSFKSLELNILPLWYETRYFKAFTLLVVVLTLYLIQRMSIRRVQKRNRNLELGIAERTKELEDTLHSLRFSEEELTRQLRLHVRMVASISHDVRTPVHYIRVASEGIESYLGSGEIPQARRLASTIGSTSKRLVNLLDSMVAFTKSEMSETQALLQETNLGQLVIEKTELFKTILEAQKGRLYIDIPDDILIVVNPNLLSVIIHNLIDNAVKVKDGNTIYVVAKTQDGTIWMTVRDSGPGMPAELVTWLNRSSNKACRGLPMPEEYNGLGLMMVSEIAQILGIRIFVEVGEGTSVHLIFR